MQEITVDSGKQPKYRIPMVGKILCGLVFLMAIATLAGSVYIAIRAYTPVWFWDEWALAVGYKEQGGRYPLSNFWALHNEHRIPLERALQLLDLFLLKGNRMPLLVLNGMVQVCLWCLLVYFLHLMRRFNKMELATLAGIAGFLVFNPNQMENFNWFFQTAFLSSFLFAVTALAAISAYAYYDNHLSPKTLPRKCLMVAILSAFVAEFNLASGLLTWIMLPVCGALVGVRRRIVILLCAVALPAIGVYLIGYQRPEFSASPLNSVRHPDQVFAYLLAYFSESWHYFAARVGPAATVMAFVFITCFLVRSIIRSERLEPVQGFALSLALMMLLSAFMAALGRQNVGAEQARVARYQTPAMLFWWGLVLLIVATLTRMNERTRVSRSYVFFALQIVFLGLFVAEARRYPELLALSVTEGFMRSTGGLALEAGIYDEPQIRSLFPTPTKVIPAYNLLLHQGLMRPPFKEYNQVGQKLDRAFSIMPAARCLGSTDLINEVGLNDDAKHNLFAAGWGYYPAGDKAFRRVLAVSTEGTIMGVGVSGIRRPEIAAAHPEIVTAYTGWRLYAVTERPAIPLQVYGIIPGTNQVCLLPGSRITPAPLPPPVLPAVSSISNALVGYMETLNHVVIGNSNDSRHPAHIDSSRKLDVEGWVVSGDAEHPMEHVFAVYPGGRLAGIPVARSDVAEYFKKGSLLMSGYLISIPPGTLPPGLQPIQIVGVRGDKFYKLPAMVYLLSERRP